MINRQHNIKKYSRQIEGGQASEKWFCHCFLAGFAGIRGEKLRVAGFAGIRVFQRSWRL